MMNDDPAAALADARADLAAARNLLDLRQRRLIEICAEYDRLTAALCVIATRPDLEAMSSATAILDGADLDAAEAAATPPEVALRTDVP